MSAAGKPSASATRRETLFYLQQAFKLALSLVLFYWLALGMNWDLPKYGALAIVIVSLGTTGASIEMGIMRVVGTTVGVAVGFLILGLFNHDRWALMLALAVHITVIGYFMQTSRYPYAWYVAAFVPLVVWGDNHPHFDSAFYFGTFRWLETTVGVLIYTMVDLVFWPHHAGDQLNQYGRDLWADVRELFGNSRQQLEQGQLPEGASNLRTRLAGTLARAIATLQQAYCDTPEVNNQRRVWEVWRVKARVSVDALELWRESIDDCRELNLDRLLPGLAPALDTLEKRLERIDVLWGTRQAADDAPDADDGPLMETPALDLDRTASAGLSHFERAAVMSFVGQLGVLDQASRELLQTMRILAGLEPSRGLRVSSLGRDKFQPSQWDPGRLLQALFPPAAFIAGFFFWVLLYPPPGAKVPMFAAILSLVSLRTSVNPRAVWVVWLLSVFFVVSPVYWLVMPKLSTGFALLSLIFVYSFIFCYLSRWSPALKSGPIIMFIVMSGIANQQSYSFQGLVDGALMIFLAGVIVTMVYYLFTPMRPEQALLRSVRRFFHGCAQVTGGFALDDPLGRARGRRIRKRYFQSMVLPAPGMIQTAQKHLDYRLYPDNPPHKVERLHDSIQSISYRLQSLELAHDRVAHHAAEVPESFARVRRQLRDILQRVFARWARCEMGDEFEQQRGSLQHAFRDLQQQLDTLETSGDRDSISDRMRTDLYTMLGSVRGLIDAMANAQGVINQINWPQWAAARF